MYKSIVPSANAASIALFLKMPSGLDVWKSLIRLTRISGIRKIPAWYLNVYATAANSRKRS